jgi:uncharacterized membrane protein
MVKNRLEAFSDGVFAIIITIMVLDLKIPHDPTWDALRPVTNTFLSYVLSFIYVGIYWNNHHHMLHLVERVTGSVLWANLLLLFWLSLIPFVTGWMGETRFAGNPVAAYGVVLLMAAISYWVLQRTLIGAGGRNKELGKALGSDLKGKLSPLIYLAAIAMSFYMPWVSMALYGFAAAIWFIPDRRIEEHVLESEVAVGDNG